MIRLSLPDFCSLPPQGRSRGDARGGELAPTAHRTAVQQRYDPRNDDLIVNVAGRLVHRDEAGVSPFDSAVQGGDAVWEGLRLYDGRIFRVEEHLDRLQRSARALP